MPEQKGKGRICRRNHIMSLRFPCCANSLAALTPLSVSVSVSVTFSSHSWPSSSCHCPCRSITSFFFSPSPSPKHPFPPLSLPLPLPLPLPAAYLPQTQLPFAADAYHDKDNENKQNQKEGHGGDSCRNTHEEVKHALFYYLYETRGLSLMIARHIAFNSPVFARKLVSASSAKVTTRRRKRVAVARAVERYLSKIPINEFEPFLESIGVAPAAMLELLPEDDIFLARKPALLQNVEALRAFGVPMRSIGLIYSHSGARAVLCEEGAVLQEKLLAYQSLGLANSCLAPVFASCPEFLAADDDSIITDFEKFISDMADLGFHRTEMCSMLESLCGGEAWWSVLKHNLKILSRLGCSKESCGALFRQSFGAVCRCPANVLKFRVDYLSRLGMAEQDIGEVILSNTSVLRIGADRPMVRNVQLLRATGLKKAAIVEIVKRFPSVLGPGIVDISEDVLKEFALKERRIRALKNRKERLLVLSEFGLDEDSAQALHIIKETYGNAESLQRKLSFLRSHGVSSSYICQMMKIHPRILQLSQELLEKKVNYLVHTIAVSPETLQSCLLCLRFSLEKRIMPRCRFWIWLKQQKLIRQNTSIRNVLICSDKRFFERYLSLRDDAFEVFEKIKLECCNES